MTIAKNTIVDETVDRIQKLLASTSKPSQQIFVFRKHKEAVYRGQIEPEHTNPSQKRP